MPSYTNIDKPAQGDATKKPLVDAIIDNIAYLKGETDKISLFGLPNGSFETDTDSDGAPDGWTRTDHPGSSNGIDSTDHSHGSKCFKFNSPGGAGNGGGYITSSDFFMVDSSFPLLMRWAVKCSVANVRFTVEIHWFDSAKALLSTSTLWDDSATNPTVWMPQCGAICPVTNARYAKVKISGGELNGTGGIVRIDNVTVEPVIFWNQFNFSTPGTIVWTCPQNVRLVEIACYGAGAGGGGGDGSSDPGGGGGGGAFALKYVLVVPGTDYTIIVGAGGAGGPISSNGANGEASTFSGSGITTISAGGGSFGHGDTGGTPGAGGAGGTATGGDLNINGTAGANAVFIAPRRGGQGGKSAAGFKGGDGTTGAGTPGKGPGAGGGGGMGSGAAGKDGIVTLRF